MPCKLMVFQDEISFWVGLFSEAFAVSFRESNPDISPTQNVKVDGHLLLCLLGDLDWLVGGFHQCDFFTYAGKPRTFMNESMVC